MSNEEDDFDIPEEWGEIKVSELTEDQAEFLLMMLMERREQIEEEIENYQALERLRAKKAAQTKGHFFHQCRGRSKYRRADICDHAHEERPDSEDVQPFA
jgi:hypothetical protein